MKSCHVKSGSCGVRKQKKFYNHCIQKSFANLRPLAGKLLNKQLLMQDIFISQQLACFTHTLEGQGADYHPCSACLKILCSHCALRVYPGFLPQFKVIHCRQVGIANLSRVWGGLAPYPVCSLLCALSSQVQTLGFLKPCGKIS